MWIKTREGRLINLNQFTSIEKSASGWGSQLKVVIRAVKEGGALPPVELYSATVDAAESTSHLSEFMERIETAIRSGELLLEL